MKRILLIFIVTVITLSACAPRNVFPEDVVRRLCDAEAGLPSGKIYSTSADEGSPEHLRSELLTVTYGIPMDFDGIESAAVWLSGVRHPTEFAVFLCKDANAAEDISLFCNQRLRDLQTNAHLSAPLCEMTEEDYKEYISSALVTISGRYVCLIISSDPRTARREFIRAV